MAEPKRKKPKYEASDEADASDYFVERIASELSLDERCVAALVALLSEDSTVPFIVRYR